MRALLIVLLCSMTCFLGWADVSPMQGKQSGFVRNMGQICDQFGKRNAHVVAGFFSNNYDLLITESGFSHQLRYFNGQETQYQRIDVSFISDAKSTQHIDYLFPFEEAQHFIMSGMSGPKEIRDVHQYGTIYWRNVWPNIDVEFTTVENAEGVSIPKINFLLKNASDLPQIRMGYAGQEKLVFGSDDLKFDILTSLGIITETIPYSFVVEDDKHREVSVRYHMLKPNQIGFTADDTLLKSSSPLVIDPIPSPSINWSTYYGGVSADQGMKTVIDGMGGVYLGGITQSSAGIATAGAHQGTYGGSPFFDVFVAKFDVNGNRIWATYFGGTADEQLYDMVVDPAGNVVFTGSSASAGMATGGTHQTSIGGNSDVIIGKLNPMGALVWSTYYGGSLNEAARGITLNGTDIAICGQTASTNNISSLGAHQLALAGGASDGFIASFTSTGLMNWASYFGGTGTDVCYQIKTNVSSEFIIVSSSNSSGLSTAGAFQVSPGGSNDAVVSKFTSAGTLSWSTYYGSNLSDNGYGLTLDISGDIFVTGQTSSSAGIASAGAYDVALSGPSDGFILSLSNAGMRNWSTYVGGASQDVFYSAWTDGLGSVYAVGNTASNSGVVTVGATQSAYGGGSYDGLLCCFDISGTVNWITYFGGSADDFIRSAAGDAVTHLYVAGFTSSANNISTPGAHQTTLASSSVYDGFLSDYTLAMSLPVELISFEAYYSESEDQVHCSWTISDGIQCHGYFLEKSGDGFAWESINELDCSDAWDGVHFMDTDANPDIGLQYYRINQINNSGEISSLTKSVMVSAGEGFHLFPNPTNGEFFLSSNDQSMSSWALYDMMGNLIYRENLGETNDVQLIHCNVSGISVGQYLMAVKLRDGSKVYRTIAIH